MSKKLFWTTEKRRVSDLVPHETNPRVMTEKQVKDLTKSLKKFDFVEIPVINTDNKILAGHQRLKIMNLLGRGDEEVDVRVPSRTLTDAEAKEYLIRSNKNTGDWDYDMLGNNFDVDFLKECGFEESELLGEESEGVEPTEGDDETPMIEKHVVTVLGDVYTLGDHRLMCGDSTNIDQVETLMNGHIAEMVFTDPPYGVEFQSNSRKKTRKFEVLKNDDVFLDFLPILEAFTKGFVFIWTSWKVQNEWINMFSGFGYPTNMVVWHKPGGGIGDLKKTFSSDYEVALVWHRGAELTGKRIGSVWTVNRDLGTQYMHPIQKPVELAVQALECTTSRSHVVLDLFGGSGSTLIACEKTRRKCHMMELDPKYCDVIVRRYVAFCKRNGRPVDVQLNGNPCTAFNDAAFAPEILLDA